VLLLASAMAAAFGQLASAVITAAMLVLSVALNFVQNHRSRQAIRRLRARVGQTATVVRDGVATTVLLAAVVPGDGVQLAAADARLLEAKDLFLNAPGSEAPVSRPGRCCPAEGSMPAAQPLVTPDVSSGIAGALALQLIGRLTTAARREAGRAMRTPTSTRPTAAVTELRQRLSAARLALARTVAMTDEERTTLEAHQAGEIAGDAATGIVSGLLERLAGQERHELDEIDAAQARLEAGVFGTCESCHRAIPLARLRAIPTARLCAICQARNEAVR
jgi:RNA polymerase-binding transcription factor DksA